MIGVAYNIYDGEELLEQSIAAIRKNVDLVVVVYQDVSNFGNRQPTSIRPMLESLSSKGLVDIIVEYVPDISKRGHGNEISKRQIGLDTCRKNGCTYFLSMDCDEFYRSDEFEAAKQTIIEEGYDSSACMMQTYYKDPTFAVDPPETYFVPFIYKADDRKFSLGNTWPVTVDPTRRLSVKRLLVLDRSTIQMHHMSYVRRDIRSKLLNSSANANFRDRIEEISKYHDNWEPGRQVLFAGKEKRLYNVVKVENYFNITI
jgi:hypothetical protein